MPQSTAIILNGDDQLELMVEVLSLEVRKELDRIPEARLVLLDGNPASRSFPLSDRRFFAPGERITIQLAHQNDRGTTVFVGVVVRHALEARDAGSELRVELKDAALAMTRGRRSMALSDVRDDEVYGRLARKSGLAVGVLDPTAPTHRQLVQYNATDWDFLLSRADINGQVVVVDDGVLSVRDLTAPPAQIWPVYWGLTGVNAIELELDVSGQYAGMESHAWDPTAHRATTAQAVAPTGGAVRDDAASLADSLRASTYSLVLPGAAAVDELRPWADARLARSRLALLRGRVVLDGNAAIRPLDHVQFEGLGERFTCKALVSGVAHRLDHDGWTTELTLGLSPEWFARKPDIADVPAGGLLPPATTLQIGVIVAIEADPLNEFRVQVELPALGAADNRVWARLARPDAGDHRGFQFWPELDDEVVVGFFAGDPRQAVVLGALHSSGRPPTEAPRDANDARAIVSRSGTSIRFDDKKSSITIKTPKGLTVVLDDEAESMRLADPSGNTITLDAKGVKIVSSADIELDASQGKVVIKGTAVDIQ